MSYALGAGKAIVSTAYRYAEEMLADGRGRLVPFRDSEAIAAQVVDLLSNDRSARRCGNSPTPLRRDMVWSDVGAAVPADLSARRVTNGARRPRIHPARTLRSTDLALSAPRLDHLRVLTDETGILQHARFNVPDRNHGYCTDDNARALIVALAPERAGAAGSDSLVPLAIPLSRLPAGMPSIREAARFRNFMSYDRRWQEAIGSEDAHGRALWALGQTVLDSSPPGMAGAAMALFEQSLPAAPEPLFATRLGLCAARPRRLSPSLSGASDARQTRDRACRAAVEPPAQQLGTGMALAGRHDNLRQRRSSRTRSLSPVAALERTEMVDAGIASLRWLMDIQTDARGHFVPIGNDGWFARNGTPARFDQQPIEAQHMVDALLEVYRVTGDPRWLENARCCFEWFLGRNDLQQAIADDTTGACRDGLRPDGVNQNQGAESTIAWLHASLRLTIALEAGASETRAAADELRRSAHPALPVSERVVAATH